MAVVTSPPDSAERELGQSGTLMYAGVITGEEYNQNLVGVRGNEKYEIMRRSDSTVRGALQVCKLPILSTTWRVAPAKLSDGTITPEAQAKADFINRELFDRKVNWRAFLKMALTQFDFGHSVFEKVFELTEYEGKLRWGIAKLASRKQVSISKWQTSDGQPGITQVVPGKNVSIPRDKLIIFTFDKEGENYSGTSLLRYIYKDWDIKDKLTLVNAMALEKLGVGVPIVTNKENVTPAPGDEDKAINALMNMRANNRSYMKIPNTMNVEMLDLKGNTTKDVIPTLNYHDSRIMKSILAGFLEIGGSSGSGSQALSTDLSSLFMKSEEAVANDIVWTVGEDLIHQLCDINWTDMSEGYPTLEYGQIADDDTTALATALSSLFTSGALTNTPETEDHIREIYHLPGLTEDDKLRYDELHAPPQTGFGLPPGGDVQAAIREKIQAARDYRDQLVRLLDSED